jgi:hypothetical protein
MGNLKGTAHPVLTTRELKTKLINAKEKAKLRESEDYWTQRGILAERYIEALSVRPDLFDVQAVRDAKQNWQEFIDRNPAHEPENPDPVEGTSLRVTK